MTEAVEGAPLLSARGLTKRFRSGSEALTVFEGVDLDLRAGELIGVFGPSGTGKTTLLNLLGGLDRPTEGAVALGGVALGSLSDDDLSRLRGARVGFVFQFHHLLPELSALENVALPLLMSRVPRRRAFERARVLLGDVGLDGRLKHLPSQLSGGESQRVAVARALARSPDLLLADEPTGNLDAKNKRVVTELLSVLNAEKGLAVVVVSHDETFRALVKTSYRLGEGRLALLG